MKLATLVAKIAERTGTSKRQARAMLDVLSEQVTEALQAQESVRLPGLGTFKASWRAERTIRGVRNARKIHVPGAWVARFKGAAELKRALAEPAGDDHTEARRVARTLVSDLTLYGGGPPLGLSAEMAPEEVQRRCAVHYGSLWADALGSFGRRLPDEAARSGEFLGAAAHELLCARRS
ncbi:MAG: HU family DNA-binding protein [Myxococcales bacterium]|nr:HU family DNA-binding protein [Myxococcales bacterium]